MAKRKLMSEKYPKAAAPYDAAMTFEEIGKRLGIPKKTVYFHFVSALRKLRRRPSRFREFKHLVEMRAALRSAPTWPDHDV